MELEPPVLPSTEGETLLAFASATNLLLDHGINLIEWGDQVLHSYGYPIDILIYDFAVHDPLLDEAMNLISTHGDGFELADPSEAEKAHGLLGTVGYHFVFSPKSGGPPTILHLLPESVAHLWTSDCEHVHSPFDPSHGLYRPRVPQHCVSLIKCMQDYPADSDDRWTAERVLRILIAVAVYKRPHLGERIWSPDGKETKAEFHARQNAVVKEIEGWKLYKKDEPYRPYVIKFVLTGSFEKTVGVASVLKKIQHRLVKFVEH
ncbi:hypothetical protein ABW21_db0206842 [Orbilia brochopaga]|nr:hypothetical protein ABW21_db0206842 [Drechslerella brochopaga]